MSLNHLKTPEVNLSGFFIIFAPVNSICHVLLSHPNPHERP